MYLAGCKQITKNRDCTGMDYSEFTKFDKGEKRKEGNSKCKLLNEIAGKAKREATSGQQGTLDKYKVLSLSLRKY